MRVIEMEGPLKSLKSELDKAIISTVSKAEMKETLAGFQKKFLEEDKAIKAAALQMATEKMEESLANSDSEFVVSEFDNIDPKTVTSLLTSLKGKYKGKALMVLSKDVKNQRVSHQCVVPKSLVEKGLSASDWAETVAAKVGGKKGGKAENAQGSGTNLDQVGPAVSAAISFAQLKLS
jgi:alanyl-tRNA synthetase